jgi:2-polyprenyl-3-methyl-5-hydroxy-6-metoxy-1,4-benzoquinol methylase
MAAVKKSVRCPLCGADDKEQLHAEGVTGAAGPVVRCRRCRLVYVSPVQREAGAYDLDLSADERLERLRPKSYENEDYLREQRWRSQDLAARLRQTWQMKPGGCLLDVGCSTGALLEAATRQGYESSGVEPWAAVAAHAAHQGYRVTTSTLREAQFPKASYDVVTLIHVLEHLEEPLEELREIRRILRHDGILVVEVPNIESLGYRLTGRRWRNFIADHLMHFSPASLRQMLGRCGFEVIRERKVGRTMSLGYFAEKLGKLRPGWGRRFGGVVRRLGLEGRSIHVNLRDIVAVWARPAAEP